MNSLQHEILNIFKSIKEIFERNGIDYFAIGGTCIGAVRHNGFIPWDDDLDIAVPIEQFDNMLNVLKKELPSELALYTCHNRKHYRYIFVKVINTKTTFIEKSELEYQDAYKGVFVDIMPLGGVQLTKSFYWKIKKNWALNVCKRVFEPSSSILRRIVNGLIYCLPVKYNHFSNKYFRFLSKYSFADSLYVGYVWYPYIKDLTFEKKWFSSFVEIPFEDTSIRCPIGYDEYLKKQFGDYMRMPPEKERIGHHFALINLDRSYQYYIDNPQKVKEDYKDE